MAVARAGQAVAVAPLRAFELWTDTERWPSFVEGFERIVSAAAGWPATGSEIVWESVPEGRGRVSERVVAVEAGRSIQTEVAEERLAGVQTVTFSAVDGGALAELSLDYRLVGQGPFGWLADALFIRRAEVDSIRRTLRRFAIEAADGAAL